MTGLINKKETLELLKKRFSDDICLGKAMSKTIVPEEYKDEYIKAHNVMILNQKGQMIGQIRRLTTKSGKMVYDIRGIVGFVMGIGE